MAAFPPADRRGQLLLVGIIVPYEVKLERIQLPASDTIHNRTGTILQASFQIRTYVKPAPGDTLRRPPAAAPGRPGAAPARRGD